MADHTPPLPSTAHVAAAGHVPTMGHRPSATHAPPTTYAPFSVEQQATLDALADLLIPASDDGCMPSAKSLALLADGRPLTAPERALFEQGLADLEARSSRLHGTAFAHLPAAEAMALVDALRQERSAFLQSYMVQIVGRYLAHESVLPLIGLPVRPHWPEGHVVAPGDWSLIDVVRKRGKIYREV